MHPTTLRRAPLPEALTTRTMLLISPRTTFRFRPGTIRAPCRNGLQARNLWWWSRHGSEWTTPDESLDERMQRYQKIMKYRYSKSLRRRAMWDREDYSRRAAWVWRLPNRWMGSRWADHKNISSGKHLQAEINNEDKHEGKEPKSWDAWEEKWNKDFESFRAAIDKAIDRDPYGTLFGRHLRSPPTANNSSWTSFSWIFEPKAEGWCGKREDDKPKNVESKAEKNEKSSAEGRTSFSVAARSPNAVGHNITSTTVEAEYEIDPISMRKVPKTKTDASEESAPSPKKPFLSSLFSEHGAVDIPVKPYKPHKVYGYGATAAESNETPQKTEAEKSKTLKPAFESSRLREIQSLKAVTIGTSIDTTAEFGGKYQPKDEATSEPELEVQERAKARVPETEDGAPLFSGTTYGFKSAEVIESKTTKKNDWLLKEGFQTMDQALCIEPSGMGKAKAFNTKTNGIAEDSKPKPTETKTNVKIETSLDRLHSMRLKSSSVAEGDSVKQAGISRHDESFRDDKVEDIDLLRASDVRAAARMVRETKQEAEKCKREARQKLENDYLTGPKHQNEAIGSSLDHVGGTTSKLSKSLNNVWKHVREYPQGIVAKTVQSMGIFNDNYKSYDRLDKPATDSTDKLVFKDPSLSKTPTIYKKIAKPAKSLDAFTPSQEVLDAERENQARTAAVKEANEKTRVDEGQQNVQVNQLAKEIRGVYEDHYGAIDANHRQIDEAPVDRQAEAAAASGGLKVHALQTASVKPGVIKDPIIEYHVNIFEPKLAELVDSTKHVRNGLREISSHIKEIKLRRASQPAAATKNIANTESGKSSAQVNGAMLTLTDPPPTYVFLAYNADTAKVDVSNMSSRLFNSLPSVPKEHDLAEVLTTMRHPAKFIAYFEELQNKGYKLLRGGTDSLVFKRVEQEVSAAEHDAAVMPADVEQPAWIMSSEAANQIAIDEAAAQPGIQPTDPSKETATVLDDIPREVEPHPGPAAPTAPPSPSPASRPVRRQEAVFSGRSLPSSSSPTAPIRSLTDKHAVNMAVQAKDWPKRHAVAWAVKWLKGMANPETGSVYTDKEIGREVAAWLVKRDPGEKGEGEAKLGFWKRFRRGVSRVVLTGLVMAGFAYTVGMVAEGVGAGRTKVVIPAPEGREGERKFTERPGIYSTESSR